MADNNSYWHDPGHDPLTNGPIVPINPTGSNEYIAEMKAIFAKANAAKNIHVDKASLPPVAQMTGGTLYDSEQHTKAVQQKPTLCCPQCNSPVSSIGNQAGLYFQTIKKTDSFGPKIVRQGLPDCPVPRLFDNGPPQLFQVEPCGCRVTQEWASVFAEEVSYRKQGKAPRPLAWNEQTRFKQVNRLTAGLAALFARQQNTAFLSTERKIVDTWIAVTTDYLVRSAMPVALPLVPKPPYPLDTSVSLWATGQGLIVTTNAPPNEDSWGYGADYPMPKKSAETKTAKLLKPNTESFEEQYLGKAGFTQPTLKKDATAKMLFVLADTGIISAASVAAELGINIPDEKENGQENTVQPLTVGLVKKLRKYIDADNGAIHSIVHQHIMPLYVGPYPGGTVQEAIEKIKHHFQGYIANNGTYALPDYAYKFVEHVTPLLTPKEQSGPVPLPDASYENVYKAVKKFTKKKRSIRKIDD